MFKMKTAVSQASIHEYETVLMLQFTCAITEVAIASSINLAQVIPHGYVGERGITTNLGPTAVGPKHTKEISQIQISHNN